MCSFGKTALRAGTIAALAGGAALLIAGPDRVGAAFQQARSSVNQVIDNNIEDPIALRSQLRDLEQQYPEKIARVRADVAELDHQIAQLNRETQVSQKVVELADADLSVLEDTIARATNISSQHPGRLVRVSFDSRSYELPEAQGRASQIRQVRNVHAGRIANINRDRELLSRQYDRLSELMTRLETERAEFQTQLSDLDRQIDQIARNDRMIEMMEERQETIDELDRYSAHSLDQITGRFQGILQRQEAELQSLASFEKTKSYEDMAEYLVDTTGGMTEQPSGFVVEPQVLEVGPTGSPATPALPQGPIVVTPAG